MGERNLWKDTNVVNRGGAPYFTYRLIDHRLRLLPAPDAAYTLTLHYVPQLTKLVADNSKVKDTIIESWLEYVIIDAALKMKVKVGANTEDLLAQKIAMAERINTMVENRDFGKPETVTDVTNVHFREWDWNR